MKLKALLTKAAFLCALPFTAHASLSSMGYTLDEGAHIVTDDNGLEWLQWDQTAGLSISEGLALYAVDGWTLATNAQIRKLTNDADFGELTRQIDLATGIETENPSGSYTGLETYIEEVRVDWLPDAEAATYDFVSLFGNTYKASGQVFNNDVPEDPYMYAYALGGDDTDNNGTYKMIAITDHYTPARPVDGRTKGWAIVTGGHKDVDYSDPTVGVALVRFTNVAPIADAGEEQSVMLGDLVTLNGVKSSDSNGDLLTYHWSFTSIPAGSSAVLNNAATVDPAFEVDVPGEYIVTLVVSDGELSSSPASVTISTINVAPVADAGEGVAVYVGDVVMLNGAGSTDSDGNDLTFSWSFSKKPAGSSADLDDSTLANPIFIVDAAGEYTVSLIVNDGTVDSAPAIVEISTINVAPVADAGANQSGFTGDLISLDGTQSYDTENDLLTYNWSFSSLPEGSDVSLSNSTSANASFTADITGIYTLNLVVNDGSVDSVSSAVSISIVESETAAVTALQDLITVINTTIDPSVFRNVRQVRSLTFRLNMVVASIERERDVLAVRQLKRMLRSFDGCSRNGRPDRNDRVRDCEAQEILQSSILNIIDLLDVNEAAFGWGWGY